MRATRGPARARAAPRLSAAAGDGATAKRSPRGPDGRHRTRRTRPCPQDGLHRPADLRPRDGAHLGAHLGLLRPRVAGPERRRLLRGDDRAPADGHDPPARHERAGALQPLPAPRRAGRRQPQGQHRQRLRLLVPRLELPPRRQRARDPARQGLRGHANDERQPRLRHEARRPHRQLPRLRLREPRRRRTDARRVPRRGQDRLRRHVRPLAARRGRGRADLPSRHAALELEVLHGEPARRAPPFGDAPVDRHLGRPRREAPARPRKARRRSTTTTSRPSRRASSSGTRCRRSTSRTATAS